MSEKFKKYDQNAFILACTAKPDRCTKILEGDFAFNEKELKAEIWDKKPGLCRVLFSDIIGDIFDIHNPAHVFDLMELTKATEVKARVMYFLYTNFQSPVEKVDNTFEPDIIETSELSNLPKLPDVFSEHNPYRRGSHTHKLFEYSLLYNGDPKLYPKYAQKVLNSIRRRKINGYVTVSQMKKKLKKVGINISTVKDINGNARQVMTKKIGNRVQVINDINYKEIKWEEDE